MKYRNIESSATYVVGIGTNQKPPKTSSFKSKQLCPIPQISRMHTHGARGFDHAIGFAVTVGKYGNYFNNPSGTLCSGEWDAGMCSVATEPNH